MKVVRSQVTTTGHRGRGVGGAGGVGVVLIVLGAPAAGVDAQDADDEDAKLQKDKRGCCNNDHGPAGAKDVVLGKVTRDEDCNEEIHLVNESSHEVSDDDTSTKVESDELLGKMEKKREST